MATVEEIRAARRRAAYEVVEKAIDRVYTEVSALDGKEQMSVAELYVAVLLVYNDLNKYLPGGHINPPKRKKVEELLKKFDANVDGVLSREEFGTLVRRTMPGLVKRCIMHVLVFCTAVPLLVWATKESVSRVPKCKKVGRSLPGSLLAALFTVLFKVSGVLNH